MTAPLNVVADVATIGRYIFLANFHELKAGEVTTPRVQHDIEIKLLAHSGAQLHTNAPMSKFNGQGSGTSDDRAFGSCISGVLRRPLQPVDRDQVADGTAALFHHRFAKLLSEQKRRTEIDLEEGVQFLRIDFQEWAIEGDTGVVHQAIDSTKKIQGCLPHANRRARVGEIGLDGGSPPSHRLDFMRSRDGRLWCVAVVERDIRTLPRKLHRDFKPDARTGTSHQHSLAGKFSCFAHVPPA